MGFAMSFEVFTVRQGHAMCTVSFADNLAM